MSDRVKIDLSHSAEAKGYTEGARRMVPEDITPSKAVGVTVTAGGYIEGLRVVLNFFCESVSETKTIECNDPHKVEFDNPVPLSPGDEIVASTNNPSTVDRDVTAKLHVERTVEEVSEPPSGDALSACPACGAEWGQPHDTPHVCGECEQLLPEMRFR